MRTPLLALGLVAVAACPAPSPRPAAGSRVTAPPVVLDAGSVAASAPLDAPSGPPAPEPVPPALRLPRDFVPTGYEARLSLDPAKPTFDGTIAILGNVARPTSVVWLHGRHLRVTRAAATHGDPFAQPDGTAVALTVTPRGEDLLELRAASPLAPGSWQLTLEYTGEIDTLNTTGAFVQRVAGKPYVYTQFEALYARRVFPCLDEPDVKVPWRLTLDIPAGQLAVSNTAVEHVIALADGGHRYQFERTRPLPSYLIAFGVGPFEIVPAGQTKSGVPVRIVVPAGRTAEATWASQTTAQILDLLEDWFGMPYPYPKLDILAVPITVGFSAMENAGLVTMADRRSMIDPHQMSWARRYGYVVTAAHELAHQWFGDYVTMAWWDDLWLNEGFANWMEHKISARFEPAWHDELAEAGMRASALDADRLVSARQIRQPIDSPNDILNAFDGITYNKGGSVLDMFETFVGPEAFQRGVRAYLASRAYANATSADFVAAISKEAGKDLGPAFSSFLDQPGAPELEMTLACGRGGPHLELSQHRYVPPGAPVPPAGTPWIVPVCVAYDRAGQRAQTCGLLDQPTGTLALETKSCPRWVLPNVDGRGYYRTQLTAKQVVALRDRAWEQLRWSERRSIFSEVVDAALVGPSTGSHGAKLPLSLALSFVPKMLAGGDRFAIGDALGLPLGFDRFVPDELRPKYEAYLRATFGPGAASVGVLPRDTDDFDAETIRGGFFSAVAWSGRDSELVTRAVELAGGWRDLPPAMRGSILEVATDASPELFAQVRAAVTSEPDRVRRGEMLHALGAVHDPERFESALALVLDPKIDSRETMWLLFGTSTEQTRAVAERFFRAHQAEILSRLPQDEVSGGLWGLAGLFTRACDPARRDAIAASVNEVVGARPGGERVARQAIEGLDQCIARRAALEPELRRWLGKIKVPRPPARSRDRSGGTAPPR